jgi:acetoin utilization deacetylase AcuC-like enzyme
MKHGCGTYNELLLLRACCSVFSGCTLHFEGALVKKFFFELKASLILSDVPSCSHHVSGFHCGSHSTIQVSHLQGYAVNVPLTDGIDDDMFINDAFIPVIDGVMEYYQPSVIVLQCGADSLAGDKIGKFNLSTMGHADAGRYLRQAHPNVPVMMLGGGGYTISNVARTWSYETIAMLGYQDEQISHYCPMVRTTQWQSC